MSDSLPGGVVSDFDTHVRSGERIDEDRYVLREYWNPETKELVASPKPVEGGVFVGIQEHHKNPTGEWCGGYVHFENVPEAHDAGEKFRTVARHTLVSSICLTLSPSLQCPKCPSHGFIRDGLWVTV